MICTRCNTNRLDVRNILIPLINDEILRFTPFWKGMDTGLVFLKKKKKLITKERITFSLEGSVLATPCNI